MELVHYPKGHHVLEIGKIERDVYFIAKGIVRAFTLVDGKDVTFWVGKEGATIVSMMGYVRNEPGYETMELMEDSILYVIKREVLTRLYMEDINIANWGRRFAETELLDAEIRVITPATCDCDRALSRLCGYPVGTITATAFGVYCLIFGNNTSKPEPNKSQPCQRE